MRDKTINIKGNLMTFDHPIVMGILNNTPDSFYSGSRKQTEQAIIERIETILHEGGEMVDIGGYSSRPDALFVSAEEEMQRLRFVLEIVNREFPKLIVSVDTFRAAIARECVEHYGAAIINDISGGQLDEEMFATVALLRVPYILMHMRGTPQTMQQYTDYNDMQGEMMRYFAEKIAALRALGVNDIIVDPGFGFSKTTDQNYQLMAQLDEYRQFDLPLLVGISRKSMIYRLLESTPEESLNGTTVLNTFALFHGANILRVHDVRAAAEAVRIVNQIKKHQSV